MGQEFRTGFSGTLKNFNVIGTRMSAGATSLIKPDWDQVSAFWRIATDTLYQQTK